MADVLIFFDEEIHLRRPVSNEDKQDKKFASVAALLTALQEVKAGRKLAVVILSERGSGLSEEKEREALDNLEEGLRKLKFEHIIFRAATGTPSYHIVREWPKPKK
jgi:hypothetical protein